MFHGALVGWLKPEVLIFEFLKKGCDAVMSCVGIVIGWPRSTRLRWIQLSQMVVESETWWCSVPFWLHDTSLLTPHTSNIHHCHYHQPPFAIPPWGMYVSRLLTGPHNAPTSVITKKGRCGVPGKTCFFSMLACHVGG